MDVKRTYFFQDGAARAVDFTIKLARVDDDLASKVVTTVTRALS